MSGRPVSSIGAFALVSLALFCASARAQNAAPNDAPEPVRYELAPKFWKQVERLLNSDRRRFANDNNPYRIPPQEREKILARSREMLAKLKGVSLPKTAGLKRVRVFSMPHYPKFSLLGFLIREEPDQWTVFTSRWRVERIKRIKHARLEDADLNGEIDAALKLAASLQDNQDPAALWNIEIPAEVQDGNTRSNRLYLLFDLACLASASERQEAVEPLLRAALYQYAELPIELDDELAWRQFEPAVLDLNEGLPRAGLAARFDRIAKEFPGGRYEEQATEYARTLKQMAAEDVEKRSPLEQLAAADRVKELVFQLRECKAVQFMQPGSCWIPSHSQPAEGTNANAADQLIAEGFDAVGALIEALEDTRLTRSYGYYRDFTPWRYVLQVRDAAIQTLVVIADDGADRRLYFNNTSSGYFSNDKEEVRAAAIERVNEWRAEVQAIGEAQWLRGRLKNAGQSRAMLLRRLVKIDHDKALPEVRQWLAEEKYNRIYAYQLLMRAGGADAIAEVKKLADPESQQFEFEALCALDRERHIMPAEYHAALRKGAEAIAKRDSGTLSPQLLLALTETGERQCTLLVAERLRGGSASYDRATQWALSKVKDPKLMTEIARYLLPLFDDAQVAKESGWRQYYQGKKDIYRAKDQAAFAVNKLLDWPLPDFVDLNPPERDAEIEKLRRICADRGLQPAFALPPMP